MINPASYEVELLDLTDGGMPGFTFTGTLLIEPDDVIDFTEWYIHSAWVGSSRVTDAKLFAAICKSAIEDKHVYFSIWEKVRDE